MKKALVLLVFVLVLSVGFTATEVNSSEISDLIEILITLGIIPDDKIEQARGLIDSSGELKDSTKEDIREKEMVNPRPLPPTHDRCQLFKRSLRLGDRGEDVRELQRFLNNEGFIISNSGGGSKGNETTFFGGKTKAALIKYQNANKADILSPVGLTRGTGFFGNSSIKHIKSRHGCEEIVINPKPTHITPSSLKSGKVGEFYSEVIKLNRGQHLDSNNSSLFTTWVIKRGSLPPGLSLVESAGPGLCLDYLPPLAGVCISADETLIDGWPTVSGEYSFTLVAKHERQETSIDYNISIRDEDDTGNRAPVITSLRAPTNLEVGEAGIWAIEAYDPEDLALTYIVEWGDEPTDSLTVAAPHSRDGEAQKATFTHTYYREGTFNPTFTVIDPENKETITSASVIVGDEEPELRLLHVRVFNGEIRCVTAPCEFPLEGARVKIFDTRTGIMIHEGKTDDNGDVSFRDILVPHIYRIEVSAENFETKDKKVKMTDNHSEMFLMETERVDTTVNVVSPNAHVFWPIGSLQKITYELSEKVPSKYEVVFRLIDGPSSPMFLGKLTGPDRIGDFDFIVPESGFRSNEEISLVPGEYKIEVLVVNGQYCRSPQTCNLHYKWGEVIASDTSEMKLSITEKEDTGPATIQVLNPNGGELWTIGESASIAWKLGGTIPSHYELVLELEGETPIHLRSIENPDKEGSLEIIVPQSGFISDAGVNLEPGEYKVKVSLYDGPFCLGLCIQDRYWGKSVLSDKSDNTFIIRELPVAN